MEFLMLLSSLLAITAASWEPNNEKYNYPQIEKSVPVEPAAVQLARQVHLKAVFHALHDHGYSRQEYEQYNDKQHENVEEHKWNGPLHYSQIHNGVPVEPVEVQPARQVHLNVLSNPSYHNPRNVHSYSNSIYEDGKKWHGVRYTTIYRGPAVQKAHLEKNNVADVQKWNEPLQYSNIQGGEIRETPVVQHTRAPPLKVLSGNDYEQNNYGEYHGTYEIPKIGHDGKPMDTYEVEAAKYKHFAAFRDALARSSNGISNHYHKQQGA